MSAAGLAASTYLPALWLTEIWMQAARNPIRVLAWVSSAFIVLVAVFLATHLSHVALLLAR